MAEYAHLAYGRLHGHIAELRESAARWDSNHRAGPYDTVNQPSANWGLAARLQEDWFPEGDEAARHAAYEVDRQNPEMPKDERVELYCHQHLGGEALSWLKGEGH
jgi:hypothetical protein